MPEETPLRRLKGGKPVFGVVQTLLGTTITEMAIWNGFDFVILDCEHGIADEASHLASIQVLGGYLPFSAVRVRPRDFSAVGRYVNLGVNAVMMADCQTPAEATELVMAAMDGPNGKRSTAGTAARGAHYGLRQSKTADSPLLFAMIESAAAVSQIGVIAATPGLSGLVVGPNDLSADLGCPGDFSAPAYANAFMEVERVAAEARLILGSKPHAGYTVARLLQGGHRLIIASADVIALKEGFQSHLAAARAVARHEGQ